MRPEVRPRKLTRRSASPSAKVLRMMASVSRAGMKCRRDRLERVVRKDSGQAGRTCRTKLNTTGGEASQCWRGGVVEEMEGGWRVGVQFERNFQNGKTFKYYFQCRRADIFGGVWRRLGCRARDVSPLRGLALLVAGSPVLAHWANLCRASGAGWEHAGMRRRPSLFRSQLLRPGRPEGFRRRRAALLK